MNVIKENRIGTFFLRRQHLEKYSDELLRTVFSNFVIIEAHYRDYNLRIDYVAYSIHFDKLDDRGAIIPEYEVLFEYVEDKNCLDGDRILEFHGVNKLK